MTDIQKLHKFLTLQVTEGDINTQEDKDLFNERIQVLAAMTLEDEGITYEDDVYPAKVIQPLYESLLKSIIQEGIKNRV